MEERTGINSMRFDYYYGTQADQYNFIKVPKLLIQDEVFSGLSNDAKMLYGLLLDRMSLSMQNGWLDDNNRVFIIYQITDIMEDMKMSRVTAIKYLRELVEFGLVEKKRRGLGLPDILYIKSFVVQKDFNNNDGMPDKEATKMSHEMSQEMTYEIAEKESGNCLKMAGKQPEKPENTQKFKNYTSRSKEIKLQEVKKLNFRKFKNYTSRSKESKLQEVQDLNSKNNTNNINTNIINNNINNTNLSNTKKNNNNKSLNILSYQSVKGSTDPGNQTDEIIKDQEYEKTLTKENNVSEIRYDEKYSQAELETEYSKYLNLIKESIEYETLIYTRKDDKPMIDGIVNLIVETVISNNDYVVISSNKFPKEVVKGRLCKLKKMHIEYVLECMKTNTSDIKNIKKYLLAALYNAPTTIDSYYRTRLNHEWPQYAQK